MNKGKDKAKQMPGKKETTIVRSSAAEYLTFVAAGGSSEASVEMRYEDENLWLTQTRWQPSTMFRCRPSTSI